MRVLLMYWVKCALQKRTLLLLPSLDESRCVKITGLRIHRQKKKTLAFIPCVGEMCVNVML